MRAIPIDGFVTHVRRALISSFLLTLISTTPAPAQIGAPRRSRPVGSIVTWPPARHRTGANTPASVTTYHNDNYRTGANTAETLLTPSTVLPATFGKLTDLTLDGYAYAQPLYLPGLTIPGKGVHNVVFV